MLLFYNGYQVVKQKYIVPLSKYHIAYPKIKNKGIKSLLYHRAYSSVRKDGEKVIFTIREKELFESLLSDIWMFYIRSVLQHDAAQKVYGISKDFCPNWITVTDYYSAFFDACTILRLVGRGNVYFDREYVSRISSDISLFLGTPTAIKSNMVYSIEKDIGEYYNISFVSSRNKKTHEIVWLELEKLLKEMHDNTSCNDKISIEEQVLALFEVVFRVLGATFPSQLRNKINYQPLYGVKAIEHTIPASRAYMKDSNWLSPLYRFNGDGDDKEMMELFKCYAQYINILKTNLINEYTDLQNNRGSGIYSAINKYRDSKLELPAIIYNY